MTLRRGPLARVPRLLVILGAGLLLGLAGALAGLLVVGGHVGAAPTIAAGCSVSTTGSGNSAVTTATIALGTGTTTVSVNGSNDLMVTIPGAQTASQCGTTPLGPATTAQGAATGDISAIAFEPTNPAPTSDTLLIDQTTAQIPCGVAMNGPVGAGTPPTSLLDVKGAANTDVTVGSKSVDLGGCGTSAGALSAVGSLKLEANGNATVSTLGVSNDPAGLSTTFVAGQASSTSASPSETFEADNPGTKLDFSAAYHTCPQVSSNPGTCALSVDDVGGTATITDTAKGATNTEATYAFSTGVGNVTNFVGLFSGSTVFQGQAGSFTLTGFQSGSQVIGGAGTENYTVTASNTTFSSGSAADTFTVTGNNNTFQAESGPDFFYDTVPSGLTPSNTVDFSNVLTSSSAQLSVDAAGAPETIGNPPLTLQNGQAAVGSAAPDYTFLNSASSTDASNFTTIIGASTGNTRFLAGGRGGLTLTGQGTGNAPGNSAMFFGNTGVVVNLSGGPETTSAQISPSTTLSGFSLALNQVLVGLPGTATSCTATSTVCDTLANVATVTGPASGFSTFYAGAGPTTYSFNDAGNNNTFIGGSGPDIFNSAGNFNTFVPGSGSATFSESAPAQGANNTVDFSNVPVGTASACTLPPCSLTVNVSGSPTAVSNFQAAVLNSGQAAVSTYGFATGGADFTNFVGADDGATTFDGGLGNYTYTGQGPGNTLDFSDVSPSVATALTFDVTHTPSPLATLANVPEPFSGITNLVGLPGGNATFVGGSTGGYSFKGNGTGNRASFAAEGPSSTLSVQVTSPDSAHPITGGTVTFSLPGGAILCSSVPVVVSTGTAGCSTSSLPAGPDQVVATYTPPSGSGLSGSGVLINATGSGSGAAPATSVTGVAVNGSPPAPPAAVTAGSPIPLSATVNTKDGTTAIAAGTVAFIAAGGQTLCTAAVPGGSTTPDPVTCNATFSAGTFDVIAVYTPGKPTVSGSVGPATGPLLVTANSPNKQSSTSQVKYQQFPGTSCGTDPFNPFPRDCASATVSVPNGYTGTVNFSVAGGSPLCSATVAASGSVSCSPFDQGGSPFLLNNQQIVAQFTPDPPPAGSPPVSGSGAVSTVTGSFFGTVPSTGTSVSLNNTSQTTVIQGTSVSLDAHVTSSSVLPGGTVDFSTAGGNTLCSAIVPGGQTTADVQCPVSFPTVGFDDVLAVYKPPSGTLAGSAADLPIQVQPLVASSSNGAAVSDPNFGVIVNLSNSPLTTNSASPIPGVTVNQGQVLVAAPTSGLNSPSCSGSPLPSFCDSLTNTSLVNGSVGGNNTFVAGPGSETFGDTGTAGGDTLNFGGVATSSTAPLLVNVTGGPVGTLGNFTASTGSATYSFATGGANFTKFSGSASGNTSYLAGGSGGYTLSAIGANNSLDLSAAPTGVTVDLTGSSNPCDGTGASGCVTGLTGGNDTLSGLTSVTGSTAGGNTFKAGSASYNFTGNGNNNTFIGGTGPDSFASTGSQNQFQVGTGSATISDVGSNNTVDFSSLTNPVTVNVSGGAVGLTRNDTATAGSATYDFTSFGTTPATFKGSAGGSNFFAGTATNNFLGFKGTTNVLSFADTTGPSLKVCKVAASGCAAGQANLGSIGESFSNITEFDGLSSGNTTFVAGNPDGSSFVACPNPASPCSNNAADFSLASSGVTVDLTGGSAGTVSAGGKSDPISGLTTVVGSSQGGNTMKAGPGPATYNFTANGSGNSFIGGSGPDNLASTGSSNTFTVGTGSETLSDTGSANSIDFSNVPTSASTLLKINVSGTPVSGISNDFAVAGSSTYNFTSGGPGFTTLKGSLTGNTDYFAPGATAGYQLLGQGPSNTLDLSANLTGITANLSTVAEVSPANGNVPPGQVQVKAATCPSTFSVTSGCDLVSGMTTIIGSPNSNSLNTFYGGLQGNTFMSQSSSNTLSYAGLGGAGGVTVNLNSSQLSRGASTDTFSFAPGALTIQGSPNNDTFQVGTAAVAIEGGGGNDAIDLSHIPAPSSGPTTVDLNSGTINGSSIGGVTFTPGCGTSTALCVTSVTGSTFADTFIANANITSTNQVTINGNGGGDILNLAQIAGPATIDMPITAGTPSGTPTCQRPTDSLGNPINSTGTVCAGQGSVPGLLFTKISTVVGSKNGADRFFAGTGSANLTEVGNPGTLDFSIVPTPGNTTNAVAGITVNFSGPLTGTVNSPAQTIGVTDTFTGFANFVGTQDNDSFVQVGAGTYSFSGGGGLNTVDLTGAPSGTTTALTPDTSGTCSKGSANSGGTNGNGVSDTFSCISSVAATASALSLAGDPTTGSGVTVSLPTGTGAATVTGDYTLSFSGMSTVEGTPNKDTFQIGTGAVTIQGGGGNDALDLSRLPTPSSGGTTVDLNSGSITSQSIGGASFAPGCTSPSALCVTSVIGSPSADTFIANQGALNGIPLSISGNSGNDTLNLSQLTGPATVDMPMSTAAPATPTTCNSALGPVGAVCSGAGVVPAITFTKISNLVGTNAGGDTVFAGSGTESLTETGNPGTLDYSLLPVPTNTGNIVSGLTVNVANPFAGTVTSPSNIGVTDTFSGFGTFTGTADNDSFIQSAAGTYIFNGGAGANTLDLSGAPSTTVNLSPPGAACTTGINNNNGTATGTGVSDTFTCMSNVFSSTSEYQVHPGQTATIKGTGSGTLLLLGDTIGAGVTVTMPNGATLGTVTGDGYNFSFTGMSTVDGTPYSDVFVPGSSNATINGEGGNDWLNYAGAPSAAVVNLGTTSYTIPSGLPNAGTVVPPGTATGGNGGTITVNGIPNVAGTTSWNDILVAGPGEGRLIGGSGNERFVTTGGDDFIQGGSGTDTIDLSRLPGSTTLNLGLSGRQILGGTGAGSITLVPGTIQSAIASPGGSTLIGGNGDNVTLVGGPGADTLVAGTGTQTLTGNGGNDVLVAGIGSDTLIGGSQPVTFMPGTQGTDTLQSSTVGNTLSYGNVPVATPWKRPPLTFSGGVQANLSTQQVTIPSGPQQGTALAPLTATGGWGATVDLTSAGVTRLVGSTAADVIISGNGDSVTGNGVNDLFIVAGQNSTLTALANSAPTFLFEPTGSNTIRGGGNATVDFSQAPGTSNGTGVTVNLQAGTASGGGFPGTQALSGILNITGSAFNDVLIANAPNATVNGLGGNDHLQSGPTGGDTLKGGGFGTDTFCAASNCVVGGTSAGGGNKDTLQGGSGTNIFWARNGTVDDIVGGSGFNEAQVDAADNTSNIQQFIP